MAAAEAPPRPQDRHSRRRPFASWMKKLAGLKGSSHPPAPSKSKNKACHKNNNPYPESGYLHRPAPAATSANGHLSFSEPISHRQSYDSADDASGRSQQEAPNVSNKSAAPTLATNPETIYSEAGQSKAETSHTRDTRTGGVSSHDGGGNSTFSSPNHSERSLTTTLTTIQSTTPSGMLGNNNNNNNNNAAPANANAAGQSNMQVPAVHFQHQYPVSPASAVPAHLQPSNAPQTYSAATANSMLSDNASIMTLASSSKRRRRNSLDTNASVRALAPSSVWGGSRESLPLSVLSGNVEAGSNATGAPSSLYQIGNRPSVGGLASAERASVYSASGVTAPALPSERNSYYAAKQQGVDSGSIRSGLLGHGRTDSLSGSVHTGAGPPQPTGSSPLASPIHPPGPGRVSRRSSERKDQDAEHNNGEDAYDNDGDVQENVRLGDKDVIIENP
ncbi:hypothetical protein K490DRAFT_74611 [Saccharata proteae CBS 121410]|uniref:Ca2+-modulated nonselective cation channel polycystin n=1 Tax=Saccharata proteae CBS 121410 TaxID=1314787 RepID=A0A9P4LVK0_9PEZI|nr:hypothetical protein K490DRAFT_74611 [Saccharata proteae CBS 121410]